MGQPPLDDDGLIRQALNAAVASNGISVLSDPQALGEAAARLLPGSPLGRNLLAAAAGADVASLLRQHLQQQHVDPATAVQVVARELAQQTAIAPAACEWVTAEFARALGYLAEPSQPPAQPATPRAAEPPAPSPPVTEPLQSWAQPPAYQQPGPQPGPQPFASQPPPSPFQPSPFQPAGSWPTAPNSAGAWAGAAPAGPGPAGGSGKQLRTAAVAVAAVAVILAAYAGIAAGAHLFPFARSSSAPPRSLVTHPKKPHHPDLTPATPGVISLTNLLPVGIDDPATECQAASAPYPWDMTGVVQATACGTVPGLPNGSLFAVQLDSAADYQSAWNSYNESVGFDAEGETVEDTCPPKNANDEGTIGYQAPGFPGQSGQVLECLDSNNTPAYTWTLPTERAIFVVVGGQGTSLAAMQSWWINEASPAASPSSPSP
jgi:hypothetical protein